MARQSFARRLIIPALGLAGLLYASYFTLANATAPEAPPQQLNLPPVSSYQHAVSGSGLIEASSRNIAVGSFTPGIVSRVLVTEGDRVKAGDPLFALDDRAARAELAVRQAESVAAQAELNAVKVGVADQKDQLQRVQNLTRGVNVTTDRIERQEFATRAAAVKQEAAAATLAVAQARQAAAQVALDKLTMTAPVAGRILKVNIRAGAYVEANAAQTPVILGNDMPLYVRVSIDENDLWRLQPKAEARGALRSNRDIHFPLKFVRIEPYVQPKRSLTGSASERVDTRVMDVLYEIAVPEQKLFIGQQVDVYIKAER